MRWSIIFFEEINLENELIFEEKIGKYVDHYIHAHDALEICVLKENKAKFHLLDEDFVGTPGDVFLFRPFEPHWPLAHDASKPFKWIMVLFLPSIIRHIPDGYKLLAPFYVVNSMSPYIPACSSSAQAIQFAASQAIQEQIAKKIGWEARQLMYFIDIIVSINRYASEQNQLASSNGFDQGMMDSIEYLLRHLTDEMDMNTLVQISGARKTYFYTKFKQITGLSPNQFINRLRIQIASHLLKHTDKSITDIAFECGYRSLSHFNNVFKLHKGISPRDHRKIKDKL